jgi:hypothetical protein
VFCSNLLRLPTSLSVHVQTLACDGIQKQRMRNNAIVLLLLLLLSIRRLTRCAVRCLSWRCLLQQLKLSTAGSWQGTGRSWQDCGSHEARS